MNDVVEVAIHDGGEVAARIMDAVVGDAVLREVVGANFFATIAGADEGFAGGGGGFHFFLFLAFKEARTEDGHGLDAVLLLGALVLHGNDEAGRQMSNANGGVGGVDALAAVTAGTVNVDAEVVRVNFEVLLGGFGEDSDGGGTGMDAALRLGDGDALDAVDAAFKFELAVSIVA